MIIDEAGMADTPSLDTAVTYIIGRGGSVRLIGDDQQLAAIGAGGVLRDIATTHGAVRLTELHRFTDPAEAAATLALRDGRPEALGFYLDHQRIHVGDPTTITDQLFNAWTERPRATVATRSCSPPPATSSPTSTAAPAPTASPTRFATPGRGRCLADGNRPPPGT